VLIFLEKVFIFLEKVFIFLEKVFIFLEKVFIFLEKVFIFLGWGGVGGIVNLYYIYIPPPTRLDLEYEPPIATRGNFSFQPIYSIYLLIYTLDLLACMV